MIFYKKATEAVYNPDGTFNRFEPVDPKTIFKALPYTTDRAYVQIINGKIVQSFSEKEMFVEW